MSALSIVVGLFLLQVCAPLSICTARSWTGCVSHHEIKPLINLQSSTTVHTSIDLGYTQTEVVVSVEGLSLHGKLLATRHEMQKIANTPNSCFTLYEDGSVPWQVSTISESTGYPASLCPPLDKSGPPTLVLGGFTMHRIAGENVNPMIDTAAKVEAVRTTLLHSVNVLDTCMGLGYTATAAGKIILPGGKVTTIENDEASLEMCTYNPWSAHLFDGSLPIDIVQVSCERGI